MTDITELAKAAEKYRSTLEAHRNNPRDGVALNARDDATSKFMELVDNDELNIISGLLEALEKAQRANAAQDDHINQQQGRIDQLEKGHEEAAKQINSWRRMAKQNIAEREKDIAELMLPASASPSWSPAP